MNKRRIILIVIILVFLGAILFMLCGKKLFTSSECDVSDGYCIYDYDGKKYLVLNNGYNREYDIEYFDINDADIKNVNEFSYLTYDEYNNFCLKYGINKKYDDKNTNYMIYFYSAKVANSVSGKLGDVEYNGNKVILYIWSRLYYDGGMDYDDGKSKAYVIVIPTDQKVNNYKVETLLHRVEFNKIAKLNPLTGYNYTKEDNMELAVKNHIKSDNVELNNIINKSFDALARKHTIKIDTYSEGSDLHLISYMDLVNSVFKIQGGLKALHYFVYADDMKISYFSYGDNYSYAYSYVNRGIMFFDIFSVFGSNFLENGNDYDIVISEDNEDYIIEANSYIKVVYYINKKTYLIDKVLEDNRTNKFLYVNDNILLPDELMSVDQQAVVNVVK